MNAPFPNRLLKPILGSGGEAEPHLFAGSGEAPILPALAPRLPPRAEPPLPAPLFDVLPEPRDERAEERPALSAPAPTPRQEDHPAAIAAPPAPPEVLPPAMPPVAPPERIIVESLGLGALRVTGTSRDDLLAGGPGDDRLDGMAGDDIFLGSPGRDLFYGGAGHDTIRYGLLRAEVSLDTRFQRISLEDGEDQYDGIELIDLRDGDWFLTADAPAALVQRLYLAAGHAPSAAEMIRETAALQAGGTAEALASRLGARAGEAVQQRLQAALDAPKEGKLDQPVWLPDAEALLLERMADLALGGTPGRDAFLHWLDELEAGVAPEAIAAKMLATPQDQAHAPQAEAQALALAAADWML